MNNELVQDGKVIGSAVFACVLEYAQIFNQMITLAISICTLVYVAARAYQTVKVLRKPIKKRSRK